jgi:hypothetical protein
VEDTVVPTAKILDQVARAAADTNYNLLVVLVIHLVPAQVKAIPAAPEYT